ncbi:MAG: hypothetical protein ACTSYX_04890 [Candidatus Thorarchaeota archaeon]
MSEDDVLREALDRWGFESQRLIWIEEMGELVTALAKLGRKINGAVAEEVAEEIADVDICLAQMKLIPIFQLWKQFRKQKMRRLRGLLGMEARE